TLAHQKEGDQSGEPIQILIRLDLCARHADPENSSSANPSGRRVTLGTRRGSRDRCRNKSLLIHRVVIVPTVADAPSAGPPAAGT
ncbi:hypothetical protein, partial [Streptomyces sp. NPDC005091]